MSLYDRWCDRQMRAHLDRERAEAQRQEPGVPHPLDQAAEVVDNWRDDGD